MIAAIKLAQKLYTAPTWEGYIIEQISPPVNATDDELADYIRNTATTSFHAVGSAAMSAQGASYGVVDPDLRVKGVSGLRIVDASVMVRGSNCVLDVWFDVIDKLGVFSLS